MSLFSRRTLFNRNLKTISDYVKTYIMGAGLVGGVIGGIGGGWCEYTEFKQQKRINQNKVIGPVPIRIIIGVTEGVPLGCFLGMSSIFWLPYVGVVGLIHRLKYSMSK